jgi:hypothetical protein
MAVFPAAYMLSDKSIHQKVKEHFGNTGEE